MTMCHVQLSRGLATGLSVFRIHRAFAAILKAQIRSRCNATRMT
jgi:hypothetical protein